MEVDRRMEYNMVAQKGHVKVRIKQLKSKMHIISKMDSYFHEYKILKNMYACT